ncbi:hypothetical protein PS1_002424 [Malus domestica]
MGSSQTNAAEQKNNWGREETDVGARREHGKERRQYGERGKEKQETVRRSERSGGQEVSTHKGKKIRGQCTVGTGKRRRD